MSNSNSTCQNDLIKNIWPDLANQDLFKHALPIDKGGLGDNFSALIDAHEKLAKETPDCGLVLSLNAHLWGAVFPIVEFGTVDQHQEYLPGLLNGQFIAGHAITEPQAGSDLNQLCLTVEESDQGYILNGHKRFITNTPIANLLIVYGKLRQNLCALIVHAQDDGAQFTNSPQVVGCKNSPMGDVILENCLIPKNRLLGKIGAGSMMIQYALELERAFIFSGIIGIMEWQLKQVIQYSRQRIVNGVHLGKHQAISHKIAEMKLRLDSIRLWLNQCANLKQNGKRITLASAETKLFASEAFLQSSLDAVHLLGSQALIEGHPLPQIVNDAMASKLFSGSSEIQKNIIASLLGTGEGYQVKNQLKH